MVLYMRQYGVSVNAVVSTNKDHRGVGFAHSTDESSNDAGGKGRTISCFCNQNIESTGGIKSMEKEKAVGVDEVTKEQCGENLEENIENLLVRMKKFSDKPYPVRRVYIPKGNGKMRGLGIPSFEDKVVQGVFKEILGAIYEPKFKEFSFGFRPNRSCHDAIQRVNKHIMADKNFIRYIKRFLIGGVIIS